MELISVGAAADERDALAAICEVAIGVFFDKGFVAGFLGPARNLIERIVPGNILPIGSSGPPDLRLGESPWIEHILLKRRAFGAQRPAVGRMIRITFHVNHL